MQAGVLVENGLAQHQQPQVAMAAAAIVQVQVQMAIQEALTLAGAQLVDMAFQF
jgi:hypothetical protein